MSYVRYTERDRVVSASTDSTLRMWDAKSLAPVRTYDGHINEKNFVGLSVDGDFIACGSETNEVISACYPTVLAHPASVACLCSHTVRKLRHFLMHSCDGLLGVV